MFGAPNNAAMHAHEISPAEIINRLGGTNAVARKALVRPPSVSEWKRNGIPEERLVLLAFDIERVLGIPRWKLLPKRWTSIWPELIGTEGAPPVPANEPAVHEVQQP
jgi:hypothetical protein